jgi:hypothetical protein
MFDAIQISKRRTGAAAAVPSYATGVADGDECRRRGGPISTLRLVAINDEYSAGFRAGYFQRD